MISSWPLRELQARLIVAANEASPTVRYFDLSERVELQLTAEQTLFLHEVMELAATIDDEEVMPIR